MSGEGMKGHSLRGQIDDASRLAIAAETELDDAVATLTPVVVGDKRLSDESLERAFEKLRGARALVSELRVLLAAHELLPKTPA